MKEAAIVTIAAIRMLSKNAPLAAELDIWHI
jgi:hypothetical protein